MHEKNIIVGLDVGTTKVCTVVGVQNPDGAVDIIGVGTHPSYGLKKGSVVNIEKTVKSILGSLQDAKLMAGVDVVRAQIGVAGSHIYSFNSTGVVAIKNREITRDDVDRVMEAAKAVVISADREILHVIPQEYRVDNISGIKDPVGMCGVRLEAKVHIVTGSVALIQNLVKCVRQTGIEVENITLQPIASSEAVLTSEEKELGVVLVDIGGGTTDIAVWKDGSLIHSLVIPVGGNHFTNDLAMALKLPHVEAERIKINHGSVLSEQINQLAHISVQGIAGTKPRDVSLAEISKILGARAEELFELVKKCVQEKGDFEEISGGFVLTGGGALVQGMEQLAEYILERPTKIGYPHSFGTMTNVMRNPQYATVLGLLLEASKSNKAMGRAVVQETREHGNDVITKLSDSIKSVFRDIF